MLKTEAAGALITLVIAALAVPLLLPLARKFGLVDRPEGRRIHANATPAVGGLAILLAAAPVGFFLLPMTPQVQGLGCAAIVIAVAGVADDLYRIRWPYRLSAQVLAALLMIYVGGIRVDNIGGVFGFPDRPLGPLSAPLSVIATVGIINAVNMCDGVDGLAGTVALVATAMLAAAATYAGNTSLSTGLWLVAGALCGFLAYNLRTPWNPRAQIFLGNAGSELLGLFIACASFRLTQNALHPVAAQLAPFLIAPALIDCLTLMIRRVRSGRSPFLGDRNHLHHLLLDAGLTPTIVVATIAGATLLIGASAALALKAHVPAPWFSAAFFVMWASYFLATHQRERSVAGLAKVAGALKLARTETRPSPPQPATSPGTTSAGDVNAAPAAAPKGAESVAAVEDERFTDDMRQPVRGQAKSHLGKLAEVGAYNQEI